LDSFVVDFWLVGWTWEREWLVPAVLHDALRHHFWGLTSMLVWFVEGLPGPGG